MSSTDAQDKWKYLSKSLIQCYYLGRQPKWHSFCVRQRFFSQWKITYLTPLASKLLEKLHRRKSSMKSSTIFKKHGLGTRFVYGGFYCSPTESHDHKSHDQRFRGRILPTQNYSRQIVFFSTW